MKEAVDPKFLPTGTLWLALRILEVDGTSLAANERYTGSSCKPLGDLWEYNVMVSHTT